MGKMTTVPPGTCPLCGIPDTRYESRPSGFDGDYIDCPNCGRYRISGSALACIERLEDRARAILSAATWERQNAEGSPPVIYTTHLDSVERGSLPDPAEQLDRLILYLGEQQKSPGEYLEINRGYLRAKLGVLTVDDEDFIVESASSLALVDTEPSNMGKHSIRLTLGGWEQFHEIQRGATKSRTAFMAMPFGNEELTSFVDTVFRPAVQETGFELKRVDSDPQAGLIDNKIRVDIRLCRFLIADLTGGNHGAYWEAGYAEGLGKPVIYTCSKSHFDEYKTHFDTNHCTTILWAPESPEKAAAVLKDTIRATLPFEAKMPEEA